MRKFVQFLHRQGIHIRAQPDGSLAVTCTTQNTHNTGLSHATMNFKTKGLQLFSNEIRGPDFFIAGFGVLVQQMTPALHFFLSISNRVNHSHMSDHPYLWFHDDAGVC